jgi:hypothetical protein
MQKKIKKIAATFSLSSTLAFSGVYCILISLVILSQFPMTQPWVLVARGTTAGASSSSNNNNNKARSSLTQRLRRIPSKKLVHYRDGDTMQG